MFPEINPVDTTVDFASRNDEQNYFYVMAAALLVAAVLLLFRNIPVGPIPAGDEFQYSLMSRHLPFSEAWIPNYIFYFVYSSTNYCGGQYYACVKIINVLFLELAAVFVFLTSRLFAGWLASFLLMLGFLVSPFNVYTSMFEPETMYAAAAWMLLYFFVSRRGDWSVRDSVAGGAGIAVLCMIKPHGLFLGTAFLAALLFDLVITRRVTLKVVAMNVAALVASFLLVRLAIGFLFAGMTGLNLLGRSYAGIANRHSLADYLQIVVVSATPALKHVLAVTLIGGVPLCILLTRIFRAANAASVNRLNAFAAAFFVVMVAVTSVFTVTVLNGTSETLDRLHTRYYDFFDFLLYLAVVADLTRDEQPTPIVKVLASGVVIILAALSISYLPRHFTQSAVDNPEIHGLFWSAKYFYIYGLVNILLVALWAYKPRFAGKTFLSLQVPLALVLCLPLLTLDLRGLTAYHNLYPKAGDLARIIWGNPLPEYFIAGPGVGEGWHTHFHLDKMGTRIELGPNQILHRADIPKDVTAGIIIGNYSTDFPYVTTYTDGSITLIKIANP